MRDCEPFRRFGGPGGDPLPQLTDQESTILATSARGLSVTDVSEALGYSRDTVVACLFEVRRKLGARSKLEAVLIALRHRLIDLP